MSLSIRPFTKHDIPDLKTWFDTEEDVLQWGGANLLYPIKNSQLRQFIRRHSGHEPSYEIWAVLDHQEAIIGHFQLWYSRRLTQAVLGRVAIAPNQRGKGLGSPLISLAIRQAFTRAWINRLELRVYDFNTPAIATYRRAGFVEEGLLRQSVYAGGNYWNTMIMSILKSEFEGFDKRTEGE